MQEALIFLVWDTYKKLKTNNEIENIIEPKSIIDDSDIYIPNEDNKFYKYLTEAFDITGNENDYADCKIINMHIKECDSSYNDTKIGRMLNDILKLKSGRKYGNRVRFGIKLKDDDTILITDDYNIQQSHPIYL
jgi:hypothetical protein